MQEALCQCIFLLLFAGRDGDKRPAPIMVGDATRAGDSWCTVPEVPVAYMYRVYRESLYGAPSQRDLVLLGSGVAYRVTSSSAR